MQHVALVFHELDDRDQDARRSLPQEDAVDVGNRIARDKVLDLAVVIAEHDHGNVEPGLAHGARQIGGVRVANREIGHDQVELRIGLRQFKRLGATGDMGDPGNLPQVQLQRFVDQEFVQPAIFAQDERIVEARDQQNILHAKRHEVLETFETLFGVENRLGNARQQRN